MGFDTLSTGQREFRYMQKSMMYLAIFLYPALTKGDKITPKKEALRSLVREGE